MKIIKFTTLAEWKNKQPVLNWLKPPTNIIIWEVIFDVEKNLENEMTLEDLNSFLDENNISKNIINFLYNKWFWINFNRHCTLKSNK